MPASCTSWDVCILYICIPVCVFYVESIEISRESDKILINSFRNSTIHQTLTIHDHDTSRPRHYVVIKLLLDIHLLSKMPGSARCFLRVPHAMSENPEQSRPTASLSLPYQFYHSRALSKFKVNDFMFRQSERSSTWEGDKPPLRRCR